MSDQTSILDSKAQILKIDKSNVLGSIEALADQVKHAWDDTQSIEFQPTVKIRNVVVAGMGGSALGPDVIKHLFKNQLTIPFEVVNSYTLPAYMNENTLVLLASYSGTTEEVLACADQARERNAQILVITAGGKLKELAKTYHYPVYIINPKYNPSNQPRMAIGYAIMGTISLLSKAQVISLNKSQLEEIITAILSMDKKCNLAVPQEENKAKILALEMIDRRPVLVTSEFLIGAIHASTNQFNENAKTFVDYKIIPEIDHHLLEGLKFPKSNATNHLFVFVSSNLYQKRNQTRMKLTQQVVKNKSIDTLVVELKQPTKLTQVFESLTLFAYTNFYLAMLEGIDPAPIPNVDWFKSQLKKQTS